MEINIPKLKPSKKTSRNQVVPQYWWGQSDTFSQGQKDIDKVSIIKKGKPKGRKPKPKAEVQ